VTSRPSAEKHSGTIRHAICLHSCLLTPHDLAKPARLALPELIHELALQALKRQQNVNAVLECSNEDQPPTTTEQEVVSRQAEVRPATKVLKESVPPVKEHTNKQKKNVVQYSRRPIPTAKQKEQAMQTQHLLEMKEYFAEVMITIGLCCTLLLFAWHAPCS